MLEYFDKLNSTPSRQEQLLTKEMLLVIITTAGHDRTGEGMVFEFEVADETG
jgi:hypothetical protein